MFVSIVHHCYPFNSISAHACTDTIAHLILINCHEMAVDDVLKELTCELSIVTWNIQLYPLARELVELIEPCHGRFCSGS